MPSLVIEQDADPDDAVQLAASEPPIENERWVLASSTVRRICIAGIMFWVSKQDFAQFVDQQLVADIVGQGFALLGTLYMGLAVQARRMGAKKGPERLYWAPRPRSAAD